VATEYTPEYLYDMINRIDGEINELKETVNTLANTVKELDKRYGELAQRVDAVANALTSGRQVDMGSVLREIAYIEDLPILHKLEYERKKLYEKRDRTLRHIRRTYINTLLCILKERGVTYVVVGYPYNINKNRNELTVNLFQYRKTINDLKIIGERYGIKVDEIMEYNTSITCSICGEVHKNGRIERGLYKCEKTGKMINADVNGALNIFYKAFSKMPKQLKKTETIKAKLHLLNVN